MPWLGSGASIIPTILLLDGDDVGRVGRVDRGKRFDFGAPIIATSAIADGTCHEGVVRGVRYGEDAGREHKAR